MADVEKELEKIENDLKKVKSEIGKLNEKKSKLEEQKNILLEKQSKAYTNQLSTQDWETDNYPWTEKLQKTLKDVFHLDKFRPKQLSAINASLSGHDVILIMPTGGGKSLVYQLPALISEGMTLVVSPLVSLIDDQLAALENLGINAAKLNASSSKEEVNRIQSAMIEKTCTLKLLYVTPEKLAKSKRFMSKLQKMYSMKNLTRIAIDEVHCCSQWGHDFRPDYKFLGTLRKLFENNVPIIGLTATATSAVTEDVQKMLNLNKCLIFKASFNRPNLYYEVRSKPSSAKECVEELADLLKTRFRGQSGIIYATSIKDCDTLSAELQELKCKVMPYHASLEPAQRTKVHVGWRANKYQAVVATIAFGMGIDKPDVRFVIHHSISKSMENFYQESGRAGRDDQKADCIVYWRLSDVFRLSAMVFSEQTGLTNLYSMVAYCLDTDRCRREIIAGHFDERWESTSCNQMCDHCSKVSVATEVNVGEHLVILNRILEQAAAQDTRLTAQKLIDAWQSTGPTNLRLMGDKVKKADKLPRELCESIVAFFLMEGFLKEDFHFTPYSTISYLVLGVRAKRKMDQEIVMKLPASSVAGSSALVRKAEETRASVIKRPKIETVVNVSSDSE